MEPHEIERTKAETAKFVAQTRLFNLIRHLLWIPVLLFVVAVMIGLLSASIALHH